MDSKISIGTSGLEWVHVPADCGFAPSVTSYSESEMGLGEDRTPACVEPLVPVLPLPRIAVDPELWFGGRGEDDAVVCAVAVAVAMYLR